MLADMHDGIDAERLTQPEIEREICVRRDEIRVVIARVAVGLARARRLNPNEDLAATPTGDHEAPATKRRIALRRPPARVQSSRTSAGSVAKLAR